MLSGGGDSGGGVAKWVKVLPRYGSGLGDYSRMKIERGAQCFGRPIVSKERQILQKQGLTSFLNMKH